MHIVFFKKTSTYTILNRTSDVICNFITWAVIVSYSPIILLKQLFPCNGSRAGLSRQPSCRILLS